MKARTIVLLVMVYASSIFAVSKYGNEVLGVKFGANKDDVRKTFQNGLFANSKEYNVDAPDLLYTNAAIHFTDDGKAWLVVLKLSFDYLNQMGAGDENLGTKKVIQEYYDKYGEPTEAGTNKSDGTMELSWPEDDGVMFQMVVFSTKPHPIVMISYLSNKVMGETTSDFSRSKYGNGILGATLSQTIDEVTNVVKGGTLANDDDGGFSYVVKIPTEQIALNMFSFNKFGKLVLIQRELSPIYIKKHYGGNYKQAYSALVEQYDAKYGNHESQETTDNSKDEFALFVEQTIVTRWPTDEGVVMCLSVTLDSGPMYYFLGAANQSGP
jgi:hypothetical protein